jgi:DNA polymerase-3 subunit epsilon
MTGITDEMVATAPVFEDVAESVYQFLNDRVFVAHNVNFDYSFLKAHLAALGYEYNAKRLCTVRLSRKILPGLPSYGLGKLCNSLGIQIENRHRAFGDAAATVKVFQKLLETDSQQYIVKSLQRSSKEQMLPPNVPKEHWDKLPYTPGVYYFIMKKAKSFTSVRQKIFVTGSTGISAVTLTAAKNKILFGILMPSVFKRAAQN